MFTISCLSYKDKESIPTRYTHKTVKGGENISPGFRWDDPPVTTKSFVLSIVDPHPVANNWIHWLLIDIPFRVREIPERASRASGMPAGCKELKNSYNELGYGGPAPPPGSGPHPYVATLYALNVQSLDLRPDTSLLKFQKAIEGKVVAETTMTGYYERK